MSFELISASIKDSNKSKCGDYFSYIDLEEEQLLVLTIADGVGSCVCDWKASQTACETFLSFFEDKSSYDLKERIAQSLIYADYCIKKETGYCEGMKSTFAVVVWDYNNSVLHFTNIGDSRIYISKNDNIDQISTDETKAVIRRGIDGKPLIMSGMTVLGVGVTNAMGALGTYTINQMPANYIQSIILATDGFYDCGCNFEIDASTLVTHLDMEKALAKLSTRYKDSQKDDMTLLIARRKSEFSKDIIDKIWADKPIQTSKYNIAASILTQLEFEINAKNSENCLSLLSYCQSQAIYLGQENISKLISQMMKADFQDRNVYRILVKFLNL